MFGEEADKPRSSNKLLEGTQALPTTRNTHTSPPPNRKTHNDTKVAQFWNEMEHEKEAKKKFALEHANKKNISSCCSSVM
eukprot:1600008-Amphidinium_carterae.1